MNNPTCFVVCEKFLYRRIHECQLNPQNSALRSVQHGLDIEQENLQTSLSQGSTLILPPDWSIFDIQYPSPQT